MVYNIYDMAAPRRSHSTSTRAITSWQSIRYTAVRTQYITYIILYYIVVYPLGAKTSRTGQ